MLSTSLKILESNVQLSITNNMFINKEVFKNLCERKKKNYRLAGFFV